ncbi:TspO/MBR family protein [Homoserinibacter sp. YIM 151385]|uniref:TspO/MBR family protein n=1 Tax=Homoserinibacter sp. YIM 151385 TaxID=2985506 RepID=UPI0022F12A3D|nr:TspO/MBR family protein [Homoserinibacter sp. YIM 151385]WBU38299.1 tryptophan-rich sensory protein [Homoserinibacter sp. YIM 151385]
MTAIAGPRPAHPGPLRSALVLLAFLAISFAVAALGGTATAGNVEGWYADADKAFWTPPNAVFGPVWTVLYTVMSVSAWLVWRERSREPRLVRRALAAYVAQLVLNAIWTPVFFGLYPLLGSAALWAALGIILLLDAAILVTMLRFWEVRRVSAVILIPYWAWALYATTLTWALAAMN